MARTAERRRTFRSILAEGRFNSSKPSLQFVRNWFTIPQRVVRRSPDLARSPMWAGEHFLDVRARLRVSERRISALSRLSCRWLGISSKHHEVPRVGERAIHERRNVGCPVEQNTLRGCSKAKQETSLTRLGQQHSDFVEIARRNGDFQRNYGTLLGAFLYLRSLSAVRGRPITWMGLVFGLVVAAFPWIMRFWGHDLD